MKMDVNGTETHVLELLEVVIWTVSSTRMKMDVNGTETHVLELPKVVIWTVSSMLMKMVANGATGVNGVNGMTIRHMKRCVTELLIAWIVSSTLTKMDVTTGIMIQYAIKLHVQAC
jgi:hypothetical protein